MDSMILIYSISGHEATQGLVDLLSRLGITCTVLDVRQNHQAHTQWVKLSANRKLPTVVLPDKKVLENPSPTTLAHHVLPFMASTN